MKKKVIILSLCCGCLLSAGWYDNVKEKANQSYDKAKDYTSKQYINAKNKYNNHIKEEKKTHDAKVRQCSNDLKKQLLQYSAFLEQTYMDINRKNETKILRSYKQLKKRNISSNLQTSFPQTSILKFTNATNVLEYTNIIISELKRVQKELKQNDSVKLNQLMMQTEYLMYAWTTPLELFATKNIYDNSLLNNSKTLYKNIVKIHYENYAQFIYSLIDINLVREKISTKEDSNIKDIPMSYLEYWTFGIHKPNLQDQQKLKATCEDIADNASILDFKKTTYFIKFVDVAKILDKSQIKNIQEVSIIDNPLNDNWYFMIREYMELQNDFYRIKKEINKIIKILSILPDKEKQVAELKEDLFNVDALYRKLDEAVRYNIIDLPVSIYADLYFMKFKKAKKWYDDDEQVMGDIAIAYNKSCANMQKYMVSEFAINKVIKTTKVFKKEFNEDEWKEIKTRAKLTQDWFNMLNKVQIKNR